MIMALLIYLGAHTGVIIAQPVIVNALAVGSVISSKCYYEEHIDNSVVSYRRHIRIP